MSGSIVSKYYSQKYATRTAHLAPKNAPSSTSLSGDIIVFSFGKIHSPSEGAADGAYVPFEGAEEGTSVPFVGEGEGGNVGETVRLELLEGAGVGMEAVAFIVGAGVGTAGSVAFVGIGVGENVGMLLFLPSAVGVAVGLQSKAVWSDASSQMLEERYKFLSANNYLNVGMSTPPCVGSDVVPLAACPVGIAVGEKVGMSPPTMVGMIVETEGVGE